MKIIYLFIAILFISCGADEFDPNNPIDPDNPDYIPPVVSIVSGVVLDQVVTTSSISVNYSGNESSMLFRSKLDSNDWSGWVSSTNVTIDHLDEGDHEFLLQGKYTTGDTSEVIWVPFAVDAVQGPSLLFFPRKSIQSVGDLVTLKVFAEEVFELAGTGFTLEYNPARIRIDAVRSGDIFIGSGTPIFLNQVDEVNGTIDISTAIWDGSGSTFSGTGIVMEIDVVLLSGGDAQIEFDGTEVFRNKNNTEIIINESVGGIITD
jgi:hypothetical protein